MRRFGAPGLLAVVVIAATALAGFTPTECGQPPPRPTASQQHESPVMWTVMVSPISLVGLPSS